MNYCPRCGTALNGDQKFCGRCGQDLTASSIEATKPVGGIQAKTFAWGSLKWPALVVACVAIIIVSLRLFQHHPLEGRYHYTEIWKEINMEIHPSGAFDVSIPVTDRYPLYSLGINGDIEFGMHIAGKLQAGKLKNQYQVEEDSLLFQIKVPLAEVNAGIKAIKEKAPVSNFVASFNEIKRIDDIIRLLDDLMAVATLTENIGETEKQALEWLKRSLKTYGQIKDQTFILSIKIADIDKLSQQIKQLGESDLNELDDFRSAARKFVDQTIVQRENDTQNIQIVVEDSYPLTLERVND